MKATLLNWDIFYNRLFEIINEPGDTYYSGSKYLNVLGSLVYTLPSYQDYIKQRRQKELSTTRRDYYKDLFFEQTEKVRLQFVKLIIDETKSSWPEKVNELEKLIKNYDSLKVPIAEIPDEFYNSERLNDYLERMDEAIGEGKFELSLTLAYTCLEGFYKSFIKLNVPEKVEMNELIPMSKVVRDYINTFLAKKEVDYPPQIITLISTTTSAIANSRNNYSDSHSGERSEKWLAIFVRDNVNAIVKLLLNFM